MERAHSIVTIKKIDTESRTIRGLATSPAPDRMGDVVDPSGAQFKLPIPLLYQHRHDEPLGEVTAARVGADGIWITAKLAAEGVSARIDEAWSMIRSGLIKGLSIGFRGLDQEPLRSGGLRFKAWELLELSCVTVPANAQCTITDIKSLDVGLKRPVQSTEADEASEFPHFPRSLTKADRGILAQGAADRWASYIVGRAIKSGVIVTDSEKLMIGMIGSLLVHQRWAAERIADLEAKNGSA